jgi:hypothetical protein
MDISLRAPCAASFITQVVPSQRSAYTRMRWPIPAGTFPEETDEIGTMVVVRQLRVFVTPDGQARIDSFNDGTTPVYSTEIVTPYEVSQLVVPLSGHSGKFVRQPRSRIGMNREIEDYFGRPYPQEALALLNPLLLLRDYVCKLGTFSASWMLGYRVSNYQLAHNPTFPIDATDDPERLGSTLVNVTFSDSDPIILLKWSALHRGEPFSRTRLTWLRQDIELDPAIFTDPRVSAPSLPFG